MKRLFTTEQQRQEDEYVFPYHYRGLFSEEQEMWDLEYLDYLHVVGKKLSPFNGQKILDVGCGDGRLFYELRHEKIIPWGVDHSHRAIQFAQGFNPHVQFRVGGIEVLPPKEMFDQITMIEVLEHIPPAQVAKVVGAVARRLKKGGKLLVTVPSIRRKVIPKHYQHFTERTLRDVLGTHLHVQSVYGYGKMPGKRLFNLFRRITLLFLPMKDILPFFQWGKRWTRLWYRTHLSIGKPDECTGLLAECIAL
ncbi:MAG: class I SAM-dependent methyltransferase [archaeon]